MENRDHRESFAETVLGYLHELVYILLIIIVLFMLVFRMVVVVGPSMRNTLYNGDYLLLISGVLYPDPQQGDIVVAAKQSFEDGKPIIKRVIATEGQTVDIDFSTGTVYVDGVALEEPYIRETTKLREGVTFPLYVEEGCLFVMGDNRNDSRDSRSPEIGLIDTREVLGKAIFLLFPGRVDGKLDLSRIGGIS